MNDTATSGPSILQGSSFKSRSQRDAGSSAEGEFAHAVQRFCGARERVIFDLCLHVPKGSNGPFLAPLHSRVSLL